MITWALAIRYGVNDLYHTPAREGLLLIPRTRTTTRNGNNQENWDLALILSYCIKIRTAIKTHEGMLINFGLSYHTRLSVKNSRTGFYFVSANKQPPLLDLCNFVMMILKNESIFIFRHFYLVRTMLGHFSVITSLTLLLCLILWGAGCLLFPWFGGIDMGFILLMAGGDK